MFVTRLALATLLSAGFASPSVAQAPSELTIKQIEPYLAEFADCDVSQKTYRGNAEAFLRRVPGSDGYFAAAMKASDLH